MKDEDAALAAEFFVNKGGRKPVECSRKDGYCRDGAVRDNSERISMRWRSAPWAWSTLTSM